VAGLALRLAQLGHAKDVSVKVAGGEEAARAALAFLAEMEARAENGRNGEAASPDGQRPSWAEPPLKLFDIPDDMLVTDFSFYDVSPNGQGFVMIEKDPYELRPIEPVLVPNWVDELKACMAAANR